VDQISNEMVGWSGVSNAQDKNHSSRGTEYTIGALIQVYKNTFPKGMSGGNRVGFISVVFSNMGGVETWHKSLIPYLKPYIDIKGIVSINDPHKSIKELGVDWGAGTEDAIKLVRKIDTLILWGDDNPARFFVEKKPKKVICVHHGDETSLWSYSTIRKQAKYCNQVVAVNPTVAKRHGFTHIPNSVAGDRFATSFDANSKTVLWGHRLSAEKRPELAVNIAKVMPDFRFIFAGDGESSAWLKDNLPPNAEYAGGFENLIPHIERSSVFLATPDQEGFGYSVLEAVCSGLPVVSSSSGIAMEIGDRTVSDEDIIKWTKAIREVSGSEAKFKNFALEKYSHEKFINSWSSLLREQ
jgi:glycosyltransferase involved in cell wall biosynthesis